MDFRRWAITKVEELTAYINMPGNHPANVDAALAQREGVMSAFYAYRDIEAGRKPSKVFTTSPMQRWNDEVVNA